ncbi:hypothetical protein M728_005164 (plasmid) [Ensifer sp. WSM1721]
MCAFMMENTLFAGLSEGTVSLIPSRHIKSAGNCFEL